MHGAHVCAQATCVSHVACGALLGIKCSDDRDTVRQMKLRREGTRRFTASLIGFVRHLVGTFGNVVPLFCNFEYLSTFSSRNQQAILDQLP